MIGELVPLVMLPRFSGLVAPGTFATVPLDVQAYCSAALTFWRGPVVGGGATPMSAWFEESHDANAWSECDIDPAGQPVTATGTVGLFRVTLKHRWFRMRIVLAGDGNGVVALTCWAVGSLERRVTGVAS